MDLKRLGTGIAAVTSIVFSELVYAGTPVGTSFTYQGQLKDAGVPLNGSVDLRFELFDAPVDGNAVGSAVLVEDVPVVKGLFSVEVDFGAAAFTGYARWAQVEVHIQQDSGGTLVIPLSPRQPLTATPYALHALGPWQKQGDDLFYVEGHVGIGTDVPGNPLSVGGAVDVAGNVGIRRPDAVASLDVKGAGDTSTAGTPIARFECGDGNNFIDVYGDAGGNYIVADAAGTNQKNLVLQTRNNTDIVLEPHGEGKVDIHTSTGFPARVDVDGTLTITRPDISGSVALRLDIGRLWVLRQFGSGAGGQLELASLNRSDGSVSNKNFIFNTTGDVVIKGHLDIGYQIVSKTENIDACSLCCNLGNDVEILCPAGKRVLGGGCTQPGDGLTRGCDPLLESYPTAEGDGWHCDVDAGTIDGAPVTAWAICANVK